MIGSSETPAGRAAAEPRQYGNFEANVRFIKETGALRRPSDALEIGTGNGRLLHALLSEGHRARGVERGASLIAESTRWFGQLPIEQVNDVALPFPDASFDVVMSFDVFEHI